MQHAYQEAQSIQDLINAAQNIVVIQADNPDGDSMGSALALEQILSDLGKNVYMYCGATISPYLRYLDGWDRVNSDMASQFDLSIIVDTSADSLLENIDKAGQKGWLRSKPCVVIDHHDVETTIDFATAYCNHPGVSTTEVIYELAKQLDWPLNLQAQNMIYAGIMADSLGLTTDATSARSIHIVANLVEGGINIPQLEEKRRDMIRKTPEIVAYKGQLLQRVEYHSDNRVSTITIPWKEIEQYSPIYNPSILVMDDMRLTVDTAIAISFKLYNDGHITGKIRANYGSPIAGDLAKHFGGGGHAYSSGFKLDLAGRPFNEVKSECIDFATQLLDNLKQEQTNETLQHVNS